MNETLFLALFLGGAIITNADCPNIAYQATNGVLEHFNPLVLIGGGVMLVSLVVYLL
jgi:hypothetical protein